MTEILDKATRPSPHEDFRWSCAPPTEEVAEIENGIRRFVAWIERAGYSSFDPYDIWGTRYGLGARRLYYRRNPLGLLMVAPVLALEMMFPGFRAAFVKRQRFATADAQLVLAFLNLHELAFRAAPETTKLPLRPGERAGVRCSPTPWLDKARRLADELIDYSIPGYAGHCWGYPFDWQHQRGFWRKNTPYITCTPYCFEALLRLHDATGERRYIEVAESIATFVHRDLKETPTGANAAAGSYSPEDQSQVVNASAYRAMVLFEAAHRFDVPAYAETAMRNLNYILQNQRSDGAWLYSTAGDSSFIDHFHTCFVLKNLFKVYRLLCSSARVSLSSSTEERAGVRSRPTKPLNLLHSRPADTLSSSFEERAGVRSRPALSHQPSFLPALRDAVHRGYAYYREHLFNGETPKYFAVPPRAEIVRLELYNHAEAVTLGALLRTEIPGAFELAWRLALQVVREFQLEDGHFVTRVYLGRIRHTHPFLRWPQAQLFYALTNILGAARSG